MRYQRRWLILVVSLLISSVCRADLVQWDAFVSGDSRAVKDQSTGLVWLDLSESAGVSYANAANLYDGWGYATADQVSTMFSSFFSEFTDNSGEGAQLNCLVSELCYQQVSVFQQLFGYTPHQLAADFHYSFGLFKDNTNQVRMSGAISQAPLGSANLYSADYTRDYTGFLTNSFYNLSTYLVKLPEIQSLTLSITRVPEPAVWTLLLFALAMLLRSQRRTRS